MAYDRYDRDDRSRWSNDRSDRNSRGEDRNWQADERGSTPDDRGFFERAGDEISSWFGGSGDDHRDSDRRHERDRRESRSHGPSSTDRDYDRGYGRDYQRDRERSHDRQNEDRGLFNRGGSSERDYNRGWDRNLWGRSSGRERDDRSYEPLTGNYGRGADDRSQTPYGRDDYRRTSFAGSQKDNRDFDPHYRNWRDRHLSDLDRDYDDYRREHQSKFESDFGSWREKRQQKRGLLGQVREHMEVVGSDGEHVGKVDKIAGDRLILAKSDPDAGGAHHSISCSAIDKIDNGRVILDSKAADAKRHWQNENRSRALFEREDRGEMGPGILDRSFSGTYR